MEDLLRSQIRDSCRLALPEGLKDLMSDISREVLRAQPENLYQFIADYLSVLLVTREHLFIASRVCDDVCKNRCCEDLEVELRALSLSEEDVAKCLDIIAKYFSKDQVKEGNLLQKLVRETDIGQDRLHDVQEAVRRAFLRHQLISTSIESSTDTELDETMLAAKHTLEIYKNATEDPDINYDCVATKIQAAYRAYSVHRARRGHKGSHSRREDANEKVRFQDKTAQLVEECIHTKRCASKCSSVSLAGSFLSLPLYKPYSIGLPSDIVEADEVGEKEKERANFDYITYQLNAEHRWNQFREPENKGKKTISFHNLLEVVEPVQDDNEVSDDEVDEAGYESDEVDEDVINEDIADEENRDRDDVFKTHFTSDHREIAMPETTVIMELKAETETNSEDDDVQQNEMGRITQEWVDDDAQTREDIEESKVVSPAEQVRDTGAERNQAARNNDDYDVADDYVADNSEVSSLKSL